MADTTETKPDETNENFSSIDPETLAPELKQLYKSMQADYTRKTQEVAQLRDEFTQKETEWIDRIKASGGAEQELQQWRDWYATLEEQGGLPTGQAQDAGNDPAGQSTDPSTPNYTEEPGLEGVNKLVSSLKTEQETEISKLRDELAQLQTTIQDTTNQTSRMFSYHAQLNDLSKEYPDFDKQELLDYALKAGQMDLTKAYKDLHQDQLIEQEVEKRVKEELDKQRTQGIRNTGQTLLVHAPKGTAKSFEEATQQIIEQRATEGM